MAASQGQGRCIEKHGVQRFDNPVVRGLYDFLLPDDPSAVPYPAKSNFPMSLYSTREDLSSGGEALLFSGGTLTRGRWTRTGPDAPIRYTDASGEDFALLPGQTWIEVCGGDIPVSF